MVLCTLWYLLCVWLCIFIREFSLYFFSLCVCVLVLQPVCLAYARLCKVMRMTSQRIVIATAAAEGLELFQIDIKNTYLNREINTDIYMKQPVGFKDPCYPDMVWTLILKLGFKRMSANLCVYTISFKGGDRMIITIHVDDFLVATREVHFQWLMKAME
jgi:hypothetical protein